jgi:hypothetical protein
VSRYHGKKGRIYISTTGSGTAANVIALTTWSLDKSTDKVDVSAFADTNKQYVQGLPDVKGSFAGFWDDTSTAIFSGADSSDGVKIYLYPSADALTCYHYGPAWLDASMDNGVSQAVAIKASFVANGAWGRNGI